MKKYIILFIFVFISSSIVNSQIYSRVEANVSIKTKYDTGKGTLEMGKIYFDKNNKKLIYDFSFPNKETIAIFDTVISVVRKGVLIERQKIAPLLQSTMFSIILNGNLSNYGMKNNLFYKAIKVEKDKGLVITTWSMPGKTKKLGDIMVSTKDKDLFGVVMFSPKGEIISKQIFSKYIVVAGLRFPTEITQVIYQDKKEIYQVTTFKNILVNNQKNENFYNYNLPVQQSNGILPK